MNHTDLLTSPELLEELLTTLQVQGLMPSSLRLIGLLGVGNNATVFSVTIDEVYHVLKVYAAKERMRTELKHLRKVTPTDRLLYSWEDQIEGFNFYFFVVEMPPGQQLTSNDLTLARTKSLSEQLVELHRVRFKQRVSVSTLKRRLQQCRIAIDQVERLDLDRTQLQQLFKDLKRLLDERAEAFRIEKSRVHGDLWWPNVISTESGAYLIDWDEMHRADPAEDIAKLRVHLWFPRNAFPSRNFFWTKPSHTFRVQSLMQELITTHDAEFNEDMRLRLRFYLSLYGLKALAELAIGASIVEPILRPSLYRLLAEDVLRLGADPTAAIPNLAGTEYYSLIRRSRIERLDGLPGTHH